MDHMNHSHHQMLGSAINKLCHPDVFQPEHEQHPGTTGAAVLALSWMIVAQCWCVGATSDLLTACDQFSV